MHRGRLGKLGRIKVKCAQCGITFSITPTAYRIKLKNKNPLFFHVRKCYTDWRSKQHEEKKQNDLLTKKVSTKYDLRRRNIKMRSMSALSEKPDDPESLVSTTMRATVEYEFEGCFYGCPYCSDNGTLSVEYCEHPAFNPPEKIIGYSKKSSQIPSGKKHPDWCPCHATE